MSEQRAASRQVTAKSKPRSVVYFIQSGGAGGYIKIGLAGSVKGRLSNLQSSTPHTLTILKVIRGDRRTGIR